MTHFIHHFQARSTGFYGTVSLRADFIRFWVLFTLFCTLAIAFTIPAQAQIIPTVRAELTSIDETLDLGSFIYMTRDKDETPTYQDIVKDHTQNRRGEKLDTSIVNLGTDATTHWLVFSVTNHTEEDEWVLDFGEVFNGRHGFLQKLYVKNDTQDLLHADLGADLESEENRDPFINQMGRSSVRIVLPSGKTSLIVSAIRMDGGFNNSIRPRLQSVPKHYGSINFGGTLSNLTVLFFMVMAGFFVATSYIRSNTNYLIFSGFYILSSALLAIIDHGFFKSFFVNAHFADLVLFGSLIAAAFATKGFLKLNDFDEADIRLHTIILGTLCASFIAKTFLSAFGTLFGIILFAVPVSASFLALSYIAYNQSQQGKYGAFFLALAWLPPALGLMISELSHHQILHAHPVLMNAYWFSLIVHSILFVMATIEKIRNLDQAERQSYILKSKKALKKAKDIQEREAADQAKLLRVIERERELMAGLRELEIHRAEEMRRAKEEADEANRAKSAFLAVVSHEVRTPMNGILGMVRLLLESKLSTEQNDFVLALQKSGETMMALLNDILDFEKIETGNMELEYMDFNLPQLVKDVVMLMSGHANEKGISLQSDIDESCPNYVQGDPTRLRQVLLNLVNNAIKFTSEGGVTIELRARPADKTSGVRGDYEIYCGVKDTGIGISEEAQKALFDPFSQADSSISRKYGGTGLGLAICKKLIEAMGSTIRVDSTEGAGSTFFFDLLMEEGSADMVDDTGQESTAKAPLPTKRILVVEDNEMNRKVMEGLLEKLGQITALAEDGTHAIEQCKHSNFDLIFMDIQLPDMSGIEATQAIRQLSERDMMDTPIIALTGNVMLEDIKSYYDASMNGFLAKPIDHEKLYEAIYNIDQGKLENPLPQQNEATDSQTETIAALETELQETSSLTIDSDLSSSSDQERPDEMDTMPITLEDQPVEILDINPDITVEEPIILEDVQNMEPEEPSSETEAEKPETVGAPAMTEDLLDYTMLESLLSNLGKEQCVGLMDGFFEKSDELVTALEQLREDGDESGLIHERAHELKGMAANFGLKELGVLAGKIEHAAKESAFSEAYTYIVSLNSCNTQSRDELLSWLEKA